MSIIYHYKKSHEGWLIRKGRNSVLTLFIFFKKILIAYQTITIAEEKQHAKDKNQDKAAVKIHICIGSTRDVTYHVSCGSQVVLLAYPLPQSIGESTSRYSLCQPQYTAEKDEKETEQTTHHLIFVPSDIILNEVVILLHSSFGLPA
jgi:hypothetical protein